MNKRIVVIILLFLFILTSLSTLVASRGADAIFELLGREVPDDWDDWSRSKKHSYYRDLGVYPKSGTHYEGEVGSLDLYFEKLGTVEPDNWYEMSFEERQEYLENPPEIIKEPEPKEESNEEPVQEPQTEPVEEEQVVEQVIEQPPTEPEKIIEQEPEKELVESEPTITEESVLSSFDTYQIIAIISALLIVIASFFPFKNKFKKYTKYFTFYVLPLILIALSLINPEREMFAKYGVIAEYLLIFLVFVKPIYYLFSSKILLRVVTYRQELGVASFWFFLFHAGGLILEKNLTTVASFTKPFLFWGLIAGIGMVILGITSNKFSIKLMKKNWKKLHYITYPVFLMVLFHSGLFQDGNFNKAAILGGLFIILKFMEFKKIKLRRQQNS